MYVPRGKLLALVTIVVAAALVTGTGAFSTVETERTANVQVAGDANAYLGLEPHEDGNGQFAEQNEEGMLEIKFTEEHETEKGGQGVNPESRTSFDNVFTITNQGTEKAQVTVTGGTEEAISIYDSENGNGIDGKWIKPGKTIDVGFRILAEDKYEGDDFSEEVTIKAETEDAADVDTSLPDSSSGDSEGDSDESEE